MTPAKDYTIYVNDERTVLVTVWHGNDTAEVATRETPDHTWGPPTYVRAEPRIRATEEEEQP